MRASGETVAAIADYLGVHWRTVYAYLQASPCPVCDGWVVSGKVCRDCQPSAHDELPWTRAGRPPSKFDWEPSSAPPEGEWLSRVSGRPGRAAGACGGALLTTRRWPATRLPAARAPHDGTARRPWGVAAWS